MRFVIVTGMSGAGKSTALKMLEDMGYFLRGQSADPASSGICPDVAEYRYRDEKSSFGTGCEKWTGSFRTEGKSGSNGS